MKSLGGDIEKNIFEKLDRYKEAYLLAEDTDICCIYFSKLVHFVMSLFYSKIYNPFEHYLVVNYFSHLDTDLDGFMLNLR